MQRNSSLVTDLQTGDCVAASIGDNLKSAASRFPRQLGKHIKPFLFYSIFLLLQIAIEIFWVTSVCSTSKVTTVNEAKCHKASLNF